MTQALVGGVDGRYAESSNAVKAVVAVMGERWPTKKQAIEAWRNAYIEVMCGQRPSDKPLLTPDEIKNVARDVMRDWLSPSSFPLPGTFGKATDAYRAGKRHGSDSVEGGAREGLMDVAYAAGRMFRHHSYVYERYPEAERYYRADGSTTMVDHWGNAEHFRQLYADALRDLAGDVDAQRIVENSVAAVKPWAPATAPIEPVRGFATLGQAARPSGLPGGPGERYVEALAEERAEAVLDTQTETAEAAG